MDNVYIYHRVLDYIDNGNRKQLMAMMFLGKAEGVERDGELWMHWSSKWHTV